MNRLLARLKDDVFAALSHDEQATLRKIAHRYTQRREMDAEVDQQGNKWAKDGQEVK